tara:strand:+ start:843 stop:1148 length:306 start_codon:yes stop_codon:yes gene_type:complete
MSRYGSTKLKKNIKGYGYEYGKRKTKSLSYRTTIYDNVPERDDDIYITTQEGDRLDNLSLTFFGTPIYWWFIANANNLTTMNVEAGLTLRIPNSLANAQGK